MLCLSSFKNHLHELDENHSKKRYLLAVSGGVDSMVLAYLFHALNLNFEVAHINYKLRGTDSNLDENIVKEFCKEKGIKFHIYHISEKDEKPENSIQEWARNIRYSFFNQIKKQEQLDKIVTAHHLNDNIETFLIHLSRGSGIKGLCGIPENEKNLLRPLLKFSKEECYGFAKEHHIEFREDQTNAQNKYDRNRFRNIIIPEIEKIKPLFIKNAETSIQHLRSSQKFIEEQIKKIEEQITIYKGEETIHLNKTKLANESPFVQYEILKKFGFETPKEIQKIFSSETGSSFYSKSHQALINREEIILRNTHFNTNNSTIILVKNKEDLSTTNTSIKLSEYVCMDDEFTWEFDAEKITFPIFLRKKKEGDIFYPIGMEGKKKVSKFYKDKKLSIFAKENCWILCDNDQILGLPPFRQDRRKKNNNKTNKTIHITN